MTQRDGIKRGFGPFFIYKPNFKDRRE